ncbi:MAG: hypothetical protein AAF495_28980 [Pseudomonadota bacterium]
MSRISSWKAGAFAGVLCLAAAIGAPAWAASAIAFDKATGVFAFNVAPDLLQAKQEAERLCQAAGGGDCEAHTSCTRPGHGAIAFSESTKTLSASCGADTQQRANGEALANCAFRAFGAAGCIIVGTYRDGNPPGTVDQAYFSGRWATSCGNAPRSYQFKFTGAQEFTVLQCSGGDCTDTKETYSPSGSEQVFIYPSNNSRIIKRGPDTIEWRRTNNMLLNRCPV